MDRFLSCLSSERVTQNSRFLKFPLVWQIISGQCQNGHFGAPPTTRFTWFMDDPLFEQTSSHIIFYYYFHTAALDIQVIHDGRIKQTWHLEDFATAMDQIVNGKPIADFGFDDEYIEY